MERSWTVTPSTVVSLGSTNHEHHLSIFIIHYHYYSTSNYPLHCTLPHLVPLPPWSGIDCQFLRSSRQARPSPVARDLVRHLLSPKRQESSSWSRNHQTVLSCDGIYRRCIIILSAASLSWKDFRFIWERKQHSVWLDIKRGSFMFAKGQVISM